MPSRGGDGSDGTRHATSPATPSCSGWSPAPMTVGLAASTVTTNSAHSAIRCSQLSRMTNDRSASPSSTAATSAGATPGVSGRPNALSVARPTEPSPRVAANSTNHTPPGNEAEQLGAHRQRQAGLADTPRPGQRHHPLVAEHVHQLSDLRSPADQRRQLQRQVLPERVQRHQRRKLRPPDQGASAATPAPDARGPSTGDARDRPGRRRPGRSSTTSAAVTSDSNTCPP